MSDSELFGGVRGVGEVWARCRRMVALDLSGSFSKGIKRNSKHRMTPYTDSRRRSSRCPPTHPINPAQLE